ncbi:MAG: family 43 glycosylhydrolase [Solobacterium sp.]|nr:family 43 glycosylhydrolase [Solobacterium sp.]
MSVKKHYCNPINIDYRYQFNMDQRVGVLQINREAADPSMVYYQGKYYVFASMQLKVWESENLMDWKSYPLPKELPLYDYAPDVRVIGDYLYFCASKREEKCDYYRTKDVINGPYEKIEGTYPFWDPHVFEDEDGKVYFYYGCSNVTPIYGVEVDPVTFLPKGERKELIFGHPYEIGYERIGENNSEYPRSDEEIEMMFQNFVKQQGRPIEEIPADYIPLIKAMFTNRPYIEGPWMNKHNGKYYLQYACPGTQYNTYADGVYVSEHPLGPYVLASNNPFSYKPGGFITGAGHGSTMEDAKGNMWHISTMRISTHHMFERRVGLWKAGFDEEGELYCDQRFGDWPINIESKPFENPDWYLLSYQKPVQVSSCSGDNKKENAVDENIRTWWQASTNEPGEWICVDLEKEMMVHAIQINFADDMIDEQPAGEIQGTTQARWIDDRNHVTRWKLEISSDGKVWQEIENKENATTDLSHDLVVCEEGMKTRFVKLTIFEVPLHQKPCISGLRIFGKGEGALPKVPQYHVDRTSDLDMRITIEGDAKGYLILWGKEETKLYHSYETFQKEQVVPALLKGESYYVCVDAWNENGITTGEIQKVEAK